MGLLGSKQKNDVDVRHISGGRRGITKGIVDDRTDFNEGCGCAGDSAYLLQRLANQVNYSNLNYFYGPSSGSQRGGSDNPQEMNMPPFDTEDIDMTVYDEDYNYRARGGKRKQRHLQYQKDILTLLKGGNVPDSDRNDDYDKNRDTDLDDIKNIYEGCGCGAEKMYFGGSKREYIVDDDEDDLELFANLIHKGGKRKQPDESSINLSSTNTASSTSSIYSSSSFGYKTSNTNGDLKVMPFYSTPDSSTSSVGGARAGTPLSTTSTLYSNTSTASLSAKNYNISTTSDNFLARPVSKRRY